MSTVGQNCRSLPLDRHPTCLCLDVMNYSLFNGWAKYLTCPVDGRFSLNWPKPFGKYTCYILIQTNLQKKQMLLCLPPPTHIRDILTDPMIRGCPTNSFVTRWLSNWWFAWTHRIWMDAQILHGHTEFAWTHRILHGHMKFAWTQHWDWTKSVVSRGSVINGAYPV